MHCSQFLAERPTADGRTADQTSADNRGTLAGLMGRAHRGGQAGRKPDPQFVQRPEFNLPGREGESVDRGLVQVNGAPFSFQ